jgi:hypothetical protein
MRFYSIQALPAWEAAQKRGYLTGNHGYQHFDNWAGFERGYLFMCDRMRQCLPAYSGDFPVWGWTVDPRERGTIEVNSYGDDADYVLLTIDVPEARFILSSLDSFHFVLNNWYLALTEAEDDAVHANGNEPSQEEKETSWARIFDLHPTSEDEIAWRGAYSPDDIQACIDRVYLGEVVSVEKVVFTPEDRIVQDSP